MAKTENSQATTKPKGSSQKKGQKVKQTSKKILKNKKAAAKAQAKPQSENKFYYFDCYAHGESVRMALFKSGLAYKDIRLPFNAPRQEFNDLKSQGLFEYGQVPMLELADGTRMVQVSAILNYLGAQYKLKPKDSILVQRGESFQQRFEKDYQYKHFNYPVWYAPDGPTKTVFMKTLFDYHVPRCLKELGETLDQQPDFKFICGEQLTIYDLYVAGYMHNVMMNPNAKFAAEWAETMAKHCPERVTQYLQNFSDEMKDYL